MILRIGTLLATTLFVLPVDATPLTARWPGPYQVGPPWEKVTPAMFPAAFPVDADTCAAFEATGNVSDKATADRFRETLLSTGNETDRKEASCAFRGRDPDVTALFKRRGFPTN